MKNLYRYAIALSLVLSVLSIYMSWQQRKELNSPVDRVEMSIESGANWFVLNQNDRFLHYDYHIKKQEHSGKKHSLREMGGLWCIAKSAKYLKDPALKKLQDRGFRHFEKYLVKDSVNDFTFVNITPHKIKLGYSAMMILALLESDHENRLELSIELGKSILYHQQENGSINTFFYSNRSTGIDYYPGEALLALMELYEETGDEAYVEAVRKALPFYQSYFHSNPNTAFVPWQSRAYAKLFLLEGDDRAKEFVFEMNDFMIYENRPLQRCGNYDFPRGITTGVFMEGVCQAWRVASEVKDEDRMNCYSAFVEEGATHIMQFQVNQTTDPYAVGGFRGSLASKTMRVDNNQHAVMALIDFQEFIK